MDWKDYQKSALTTAIYPKGITGITYTILGLNDEMGELCEAINTPERSKELGDVFWYVACFAHEIGIDISAADAKAMKEVSCIPTAGNVLLPLDKMRLCAARICGHVKKYIRDEGAKLLSIEKKDLIFKEISDIILCIYCICAYSGFSWNEVAQQNLDKLKSRQERGKIQGSGDNR